MSALTDVILASLRFADFAAGEGMGAIDPAIRDPEDFLMDYCTAEGLEDCDDIPQRIADRITALEAANARLTSDREVATFLAGTYRGRLETAEALLARATSDYARGFADCRARAVAWHEGEIRRLDEQIAENDAYNLREGRQLSDSAGNAYCRASKRCHYLAIDTIRSLTPEIGVAVERVQHIKRGTIHRVIGEAEAQVSRDALGTSIANDRLPVRLVSDGVRLTVYQSEDDGKLWVRFPDEFRDGRFVPAPPAGKGG